MLRIVLSLALIAVGSAVWASECGKDHSSVEGCTAFIHKNPRNAVAYYNRGNAYKAKGDLDRAIADYNKAIEIDLRYAHAYNNRGIIYKDRGDLDRAMADYNRAIDINPQYALAYNNRGIAYKAKGDNDRAMADYNRAIDIDPQYALAYTNRGIIYKDRGDLDRAISDYTRAIDLDPKQAVAYNSRGLAYRAKGDSDRAISDYTRAIDLDPKQAVAYNNRGISYKTKGDSDRAMADYNRAIDINPQYALAYSNRGIIYKDRGDLDRAMADYNKALEIDPKLAFAYRNRGNTYRVKDDLDRAIADFNKGIELDPKLSGAHLGLGRVYLRKGDQDRALAELSEAMRLDAKDPEIFAERAAVYEAKGQIDRAIADYQSAADLPARSDTERKAVADARTRLVALERQRRRPPTSQQPEPTAIPTLGRRVALVIGNSAYKSAGRLTNPANDARAMAVSFRRLGFAEVVERYDTDLSTMTAALRDFGDRTANADWAVVYYSGHGMEMNGVAYLIPVDARLERDTHVSDEAVPLSRVLEKVESAHRLRLVILDACRNNPFVARMIRSAGLTRAIGRGLSAIEPEGGVLVAYAAKHGTVAEDGAGANSPFAEAMLENLEEPGLEINYLFRKVRDQVLAATNKRQEPFLYGSLPSERLFFKFAAPQ
jgi:tetratricopeptide (TPR) repeat protein